MNWLKALWEKVKPGLKTQMKNAADKLEPVLESFIAAKKQTIIDSLNNYSAAANAKKAVNWLKEYIDRQV
jgi:hypothetical protein